MVNQGSVNQVSGVAKMISYIIGLCVAKLFNEADQIRILLCFGRNSNRNILVVRHACTTIKDVCQKKMCRRRDARYSKIIGRII